MPYINKEYLYNKREAKFDKVVNQLVQQAKHCEKSAIMHCIRTTEGTIGVFHRWIT
jgi:hypothetical protein